MSDEQPLSERIVDVLGDAPDDAASTATIVALLERREGVSPAIEDVEDAVAELLDADRVEVEVTDGDPRYRLVDAGY